MSLEKFYPKETDLSMIQDNAIGFHWKGLGLDVETYSMLQCPYCMYSSKLISDFAIFNNKEINYSLDLVTGKPVKERGNPSKKMGLCPKCHNTVRISTLIRTFKSSFEEYAVWLYWSAKYDADRRIKWHRLFEAMKGTDFWIIYRAYKEKMIARQSNISGSDSVSNPD